LSFQEFLVARYIKRQLEAHLDKYRSSILKRFNKLCEKLNNEVMHTKFVPDITRSRESIFVNIQDPWYQEALMFLAGGLDRPHFQLFGDFLLQTNDIYGRRLTLLSLMCDERFPDGEQEKAPEDRKLVLDLRRKIEIESTVTASAATLAKQFNHPSTQVRTMALADRSFTSYLDFKRRESEPKTDNPPPVSREEQARLNQLTKEIERFEQALQRHLDATQAIYHYDTTFLPHIPDAAFYGITELEPLAKKIVEDVKNDRITIYCSDSRVFGDCLFNIVRREYAITRKCTSLDQVDLQLLIAFFQLFMLNVSIGQCMFRLSTESGDTRPSIRALAKLLCEELMKRTSESEWKTMFDHDNVDKLSDLKTLYRLLISCMDPMDNYISGDKFLLECINTVMEFDKKSKRNTMEASLVLGNYLKIEPLFTSSVNPWTDYTTTCMQIVKYMNAALKDIGHVTRGYYNDDVVCVVLDGFGGFFSNLDRNKVRTNTLNRYENRMLQDIERILKSKFKSNKVLIKIHETRLRIPPYGNSYKKLATEFWKTFQESDDPSLFNQLLGIIKRVSGTDDRCCSSVQTLFRLGSMADLNPTCLTIWSLEMFDLTGFDISDRYAVVEELLQLWDSHTATDTNNKNSEYARLLARFILLFCKERESSKTSHFFFVQSLPLDVLLECANIIAINFTQYQRIEILRIIINLASKYKVENAQRTITVKDIATAFWTICGEDLVQYDSLCIIPKELPEISKNDKAIIQKFYTLRNKHKHTLNIRDDADFKKMLSLLKEPDHAPFIIDELCVFIGRHKNLPERTKLWHEAEGAEVVKQLMKGDDPSANGYMEAKALNFFVNGKPLV
jgi:hypothetical protein